MNIFRKYRAYIIFALEGLAEEGFLPKDSDFSAVTAEAPREASHGDIATNAAMVVAKKAGKNHREIAQKLSDRLENIEGVVSIDIAGPGFINLKLENKIWQDIVADVLSDGTSYGNSDIGGGKKINIEYVSANPTGPMHIGHARGAVVGDVLSSILLKAGYDVTKEYYINDAGAQVDKLAKSAYLRYREALGEKIEIPEGLYPGEYLKIVGEAFAKQHEKDFLDVAEEKYLPVMKDFVLKAMLAVIKHDLLELGVEHNVFVSESALISSGVVEDCIKKLEAKGLIYKGILEPPKGKKPEDWEEREQTLFKATQFGDDVDRPLKKSDGSNTYFASDIAYHDDKIKRGYNHMVLVLGADHAGYVKRMKAAVAALSDGKAKIEMLISQLVNFMEDGQPIKMSKRAGTFTTVRDVIDAVGKDVIRFIMLTKKTDTTLDFDLKKVTEQSKDNPVFYVQYAHARSYSIFRNAAEAGFKLEGAKPDFTKLKDENELALIKKIAEWPRIIESAAVAFEPHRIAFYLQELAANFHGLWNMGKDTEGLRFIIENDRELTLARLALVKAVATTVASGLNVMGVEPVMEM